VIPSCRKEVFGTAPEHENSMLGIKLKVAPPEEE